MPGVYGFSVVCHIGKLDSVTQTSEVCKVFVNGRLTPSESSDISAEKRLTSIDVSDASSDDKQMSELGTPSENEKLISKSDSSRNVWKCQSVPRFRIIE